MQRYHSWRYVAILVISPSAGSWSVRRGGPAAGSTCDQLTRLAMPGAASAGGTRSQADGRSCHGVFYVPCLNGMIPEAQRRNRQEKVLSDNDLTTLPLEITSAL